jgi:hypothetical protein
MKTWIRGRMAAVMVATTAVLPNFSKVSFLGTKTASAVQSASRAAIALEEAAPAATAGAGRVIAGTGVAAGGATAAVTATKCGSKVGQTAVTEIAGGVGGRAASGAARLEAAEYAAWRATTTRAGSATLEGFEGRAVGAAGRDLERLAMAERGALPRSFEIPAPNIGAVALDDGSFAATRAIRKEHITLFDATGKAVTADPLQHLEFEKRLIAVARDAARELPQGGATVTDEQLRKALLGVLKKEPRLKYEFDVSTGKLKLKVDTWRGEIHGDVNAYSVVRNTAIAGAGYWATRLSQPADQPGAPAPKPAMPTDQPKK